MKAHAALRMRLTVAHGVWTLGIDSDWQAPWGDRVPTPIVSGRSDNSGAGGPSKITWAFVPETPNDETAARGARSEEGQATADVTSSTEPVAQSTWVDGRETCRVAGTTPCRIAWTILMMPATPAAAWVWPMFDFTDPSSSGDGRSAP